MALTKEEVQEYLATDEGKEILTGAVNEYVTANDYKTPGDIEGLKNKNFELVGKIKKLKEQQLTDQQRQILGILNENELNDPDAIEQILHKRKDDGKTDDEVNLQIKRMNRKLEEIEAAKAKAEERYNNERSDRLKMLKENAITKALKAVHVKDEAFDIMSIYFDKQSAIEETEDNKFSIIANDKDGLKPTIEKYIENWSKTDEAKGFITKPANTGAGLSGSGAAKSKTIARSVYESMSPIEQQQFIKDGGRPVN